MSKRSRKCEVKNWRAEEVPGVVPLTCNYICAKMYIMRRKIDAFPVPSLELTSWFCYIIPTTY
jgi:hypothetical protein